MDRKTILDKIRKCMALAASSNEHEAAAALRQAQKLMEQYGVSDDEMLAAEAGEQAARAGAMRSPAAWESMLAGTVADAFGCNVFFNEHLRHGEWVFVGTGAAFEVAKYCFEVLFRQVKRARAEHIKTALKRCKTATKTRRADLFCEGWVRSALGKIEAMTIGEREQAACSAYLTKHYPALAKFTTRDRNAGKKSLSDRDMGDYLAGHRSGKEVELNRGVGGAEERRAITA